MTRLTHIDGDGTARMVDVGSKASTQRVAVAEGVIRMQQQTLALIREGNARKGDVLGAARIAGIMAAKRTHELIPLCHPLLLTSIKVACEPDEANSCVRVTATVGLNGQTGVEMEAMTAVSVALLTIYDMVKAADRGMVIDTVRLLHKHGGKSGTYEAEPRA